MFSGGFPSAFSFAPSKTRRQVHHPPPHAKHCCGELVWLGDYGVGDGDGDGNGDGDGDGDGDNDNE